MRMLLRDGQDRSCPTDGVQPGLKIGAPARPDAKRALPLRDELPDRTIDTPKARRWALSVSKWISGPAWTRGSFSSSDDATPRLSLMRCPTEAMRQSPPGLSALFA